MVEIACFEMVLQKQPVEETDHAMDEYFGSMQSEYDPSEWIIHCYNCIRNFCLL